MKAPTRPDARAALEALRAEIGDVSDLYLGSLAAEFGIVPAVAPYAARPIAFRHGATCGYRIPPPAGLSSEKVFKLRGAFRTLAAALGARELP